ncbi:MAG: hypothetical protein JXA03_05275 [Bacteroidales bacterium]|nr:hypothetical protein [Bacteroidales bacterium]
MKKCIQNIMIAAFLLAAPAVMLAQNPPHPNGGNAPGTSNTPVGGGSPIDGGLTFMLIAGTAFGLRKIYKVKK